MHGYLQLSSENDFTRCPFYAIQIAPQKTPAYKSVTETPLGGTKMAVVMGAPSPRLGDALYRGTPSDLGGWGICFSIKVQINGDKNAERVRNSLSAESQETECKR